MITDLQALASTAANYFPDQQMHGNMPMNYGPQGHHGNGAQGFYGSAPPPPAYTYGNVSYNSHGGDVASQSTMESVKHGLDIIRNLFPDHQRGNFDPRSYQQVASRMAALQNYQLPFLAQPLMAQAQPLTAGGGEEDPFGPGQHALPPMDNLRTKNDLVNLDQLFSTMQSTIYDNPSEIAAAGVGLPGVTYIPAGTGHRNSISPPSIQLTSSHNTSVATPRSHQSGTPTLTPPSSAASNTSGNSPPSMQLSGMSPSTPGAMYPTLPGTSTSQGFVSSNMAPTSTIASQFDLDQHRRYSGSRLQKAAPASMKREKPNDSMDTSSDGAVTPKTAIAPSSSSDSSIMHKQSTKSNPTDFSNSNLDPALGGMTSPAAGEMSEEAIRANELWISNIRLIEALRTWVSRRIEQHDYDSNSVEMDHHFNNGGVKDEKDNLYPVLNSGDSE